MNIFTKHPMSNNAPISNMNKILNQFLSYHDIGTEFPLLLGIINFRWNIYGVHKVDIELYSYDLRWEYIRISISLYKKYIPPNSIIQKDKKPYKWSECQCENDEDKREEITNNPQIYLYVLHEILSCII
jgi:hypothetical protein